MDDIDEDTPQTGNFFLSELFQSTAFSFLSRLDNIPEPTKQPPSTRKLIEEL
jgi:hypothetical protein